MMRGDDRPEWPAKRKLIEVSLPLEAINRESAREKSIRHGHPSTLHLWWARRPLAAARAVLFAQLVDDPSAHPDRFPTEEAQRAERERLHRLIERLVVWKNTNDRALLEEARQEILESTGGNPPPILDPFAGGGTIPLEAQRLGLEVHASDLNPVAVLINKALIEVPPKFARRPPVFPGLAETRLEWEGTSGLAADVRAYGEWMRDEARKRIGHHYPQATLEDGTKANVIAWIWARTVTCPNPACGIETPLVNSFVICRRRGRHTHIVPAQRAAGFRYTVRLGGEPVPPTITRSGGRCLACASGIPLAYIRTQGKLKRLGQHLICTVVEGRRGRLYVGSDSSEVADAGAGYVDFPEMPLPERALGFRVQAYGIDSHEDLYTHRQKLLLTEMCRLARVARRRVMIEGGDVEYADCIALYLALLIGRVANRSSRQSFWNPGRETVEQVFARNALPMIWVYAESNPFSRSSGNILGQLEYLVEALACAPSSGRGFASQRSAQRIPSGHWVISTDPPYYDNVPYADLSDFFYLWHRQVLHDVFPSLYSTVATPKSEELIAEPARHNTVDEAATFFEGGLRRVFEGALRAQAEGIPLTLYYAFKQSDQREDGTVVSTGWETMLQGLVDSGAMITATWPMRTEQAGGLRGFGRNALASSVVLAVRPRNDDAPIVDRRGFVSALQRELPARLRELQQGAIAPVDLPQAAIGPGMAIFSRYAKVLENDGAPMTVRSALARINEVLDQVLNEQEGDFDPSTRFAIAWYRQHGYETGGFGDADNLARARNTAVDSMEREGILTARANRVTLLAPDKLPADYDPVADERISEWEVLHHVIAVLQRDGIPAAGAFLAQVQARPRGEIDIELVKELAFLMFSIAERSGRTADALAFNAVATAWPEIVDAARETADSAVAAQGAFELEV